MSGVTLTLLVFIEVVVLALVGADALLTRRARRSRRRGVSGPDARP